MISGHFATALVAKSYAPKGSIWLYLIAAQSIDILMVTFVFFGFEHLDLGSSVVPALGSATVDMRHSHDLIPVAGWALLMTCIAFGITRKWVVAFWCGALVIIHELCDMVTGYPHNVFGPETMEVGLKLWVNAPILATFIEAGLGVACVALFLRYYTLEKKYRRALYLAVGAVPIALMPLVLR